METATDCVDFVTWVGAGALAGVLVWAASQRGRIHALVQRHDPADLFEMARQVFRMQVAALSAMGGA